MKDITDKMIGQVAEFQEKVLDLPINVGPLSPDRLEFKVGHMREEIVEFVEAYRDGNFAGQIDALIDLVYVVIGTLLEMGIHPTEPFDVVHGKNMEKKRGITKRGHALDAVKPEGWEPPDHLPIIEKMMLLAKVSPAFLEATRVREERGARYNQGSVRRADHFPFGSTGHAAICWLKMIRLRSDVEGGVNVSSAELSEHIRDLQNYLSFWWEELNGGIR